MVIAINIIALSLLIIAVITFFKTVIKMAIAITVIIAIVFSLWYFGIIGNEQSIIDFKKSIKYNVEKSGQEIGDIVK